MKNKFSKIGKYYLITVDMQKDTVGIIDSGAWDTALTIQMSKILNVNLYAVQKSVFTQLKNNRTNKKSLPEISIPVNIQTFNNIRKIACN